MDRVALIEYQRTSVLRIDMSGISRTDQLREVVQRASARIQEHAPREARVLLVMHELSYSLEAIAVLRQAAVANKPHIAARAVVGLPDIFELFLQFFRQLSGRPLVPFDSEDEAIRWLVEQR